MAGNTGGPWGGGGNSGGNSGGNNGSNGGSNGNGSNGDGNRGNNGGGRRPDGEGSQIPEIDELVKKGQEQLRVLMGGRGGKGGSGGGQGGGAGPAFTRGTVGLGIAAAVVLWGLASFYTVKPEEQSVELFLGEFSGIGEQGLNFAPWPLVKAEVFAVTTNQTESIGEGRGSAGNEGLMLTTDENIVDIDFEVVWNIKNAKDYKFSLKEPQAAVIAISEAAMREIISQSELAPILSRDRGLVEQSVQELIQRTLDNRKTGINILRVNVKKVEPPSQVVRMVNADGSVEDVSVVDAFLDVQAAEQERDRLERQADAYANRKAAEARGESAQLLEAAEGYRARLVNGSIGEASAFLAVLAEYKAAPEVTRKRLYLETMEKVLGDVDKIILENNENGQGVVPYLPLNELRKNGGSN
ncbi:MAG: membrane protease subunit HflK [Ascidiaceihabitans sp.]|jgi:membrane protease subunit HflK